MRNSKRDVINQSKCKRTPHEYNIAANVQHSRVLFTEFSSKNLMGLSLLINYRLSPKLKLLINGGVNHLTIILTLLQTCGLQDSLNGTQHIGFLIFKWKVTRYKLKTTCTYTMIEYQFSQKLSVGKW